MEDNSFQNFQKAINWKANYPTRRREKQPEILEPLLLGKIPELPCEHEAISKFGVELTDIWPNFEARKTWIKIFLNEIYHSRLFRDVYDAISEHMPREWSIEDFKCCFELAWFARQGDCCVPFESCGFGHVYRGERHPFTVRGFHNWHVYRFKEKQEQLILNKVLIKRDKFPLGLLNFCLEGLLRDHSSIFFGLTIEFEMLLYFCTFLLKYKFWYFQFHGDDVVVKCYARLKPYRHIRTAYFYTGLDYEKSPYQRICEPP